MKKIIPAFFCLLAFYTNAQVSNKNNNPADSVKKDLLTVPDTVKHLHSTFRSLVVPITLVAYGGLSFVVKPIRNIDYYVKGRIERSDPNFNSRLSDYTQAAPAVLVYALNLAGDEGKNRFVDRTALLALSGAILTGADGLKYLGHRKRPYSNDPLSFPSGHTGAAFLAAEFLAQEYSEKSVWYGIGGYACATVTGVLRLYDRAHWFSDCVAGAGLGILSVKASYWVYPHLRKIFTHKDSQGRRTMIMPTYQNGMPGISFAMQL